MPIVSKRTAMAILVPALLLGACETGSTEGPEGDNEVTASASQATREEETPTARCETSSDGRQFCDETASGGFDLATAYSASKNVCEAFGLKQIAREFGTRNDPDSAAEGFATQYQPAAKQAALSGCLDGLTG